MLGEAQRRQPASKLHPRRMGRGIFLDKCQHLLEPGSHYRRCRKRIFFNFELATLGPPAPRRRTRIASSRCLHLTLHISSDGRIETLLGALRCSGRGVDLSHDVIDVPTQKVRTHPCQPRCAIYERRALSMRDGVHLWHQCLQSLLDKESSQPQVSFCQIQNSRPREL